ncbi:hypothetical protein [Vibrio crassostreae]|uniref:hypothetical protein n=1 Tax=Vibrio crassostreae TaxID=246167 RepID=UPI001B30501C|nr:hypothetical protein [Vibrio crassostreae]
MQLKGLNLGSLATFLLPLLFIVSDNTNGFMLVCGKDLAFVTLLVGGLLMVADVRIDSYIFSFVSYAIPTIFFSIWGEKILPDSLMGYEKLYFDGMPVLVCLWISVVTFIVFTLFYKGALNVRKSILISTVSFFCIISGHIQLLESGWNPYNEIAVNLIVYVALVVSFVSVGKVLKVMVH